MKVRLFSDLHLECGKFRIPSLPEDKDTILILAGDLGERGKPREFIERTCPDFKTVIYVLGNHEFYRGEYNEVIAYWKERESEIDNLYVLHNEVYEEDGFRFLGTTLWTDINNGDPLQVNYAQQAMNDYHVIDIVDETCTTKQKYKDTIQGRKLTADDTIRFHKEALEFLEAELAKEFDGITSVVTHHSPSQALTEAMFAGSPLNAAFHANCDALFHNYKIHHWFYGHTHCATHRTFVNTEVRSNPRGYNGYENAKMIGFEPEFLLEI